MGITNYGRAELALMMAGSRAPPRFCEIGSGSGTFLATQSGLIHAVNSDRTDYTSLGSGTTQKIRWTYDFGASTISGLTIREFGIGQSSGLNSGDLWDREIVNAINFDGSNELQIQVEFRTF